MNLEAIISNHSVTKIATISTQVFTPLHTIIMHIIIMNLHSNNSVNCGVPSSNINMPVSGIYYDLDLASIFYCSFCWFM